MPAHHQFWPNRLPHSITVPATSVWENLSVNARRYPDKAALVFLGRTTTYKQLCEGTERMAAYLQAGLLAVYDEEALTMRATRDALLKIQANPERLA